MAGGLLSAAVVAAAGHASHSAGCVVPRREFLDGRINDWATAAQLGNAGTATEAYAVFPRGRRAQYYVLQASPGDMIRARVSVPAGWLSRAAGRAVKGSPARLAIAVVGPGLPPGRPPAPVVMDKGDGVVRSQPAPASLRRADAAAGFRTEAWVQVRAPERGRYTLVVTSPHQAAGAYRLAVEGRCGLDLDAIVGLPLGWFQADYFLWPARAVARLVAVLLGLGGILGLLMLRQQRLGPAGPPG